MQKWDEQLSAEERQFVERLRQDYVPPARSASQRAAFKSRLAERIGRRSVPIWQPLAAAACAALLALWLVFSGSPSGDASPSLPGGGDVLVAFALPEEGLAERGDLLPEDYAALAEVLDL